MNKLTDNFHEEIVVRANKGLYNLLYFFAYIFMFIFGILAIISFQGLFNSIISGAFSVYTLITFVMLGGLTLLMFLLKNSAKIDYEYSFTNGIVDIAKVKNNTKRKELLTFNVKNLELMAPILTNGFERFQSMNDISKINAWLNRDMQKYFLVVRAGNKKTLLIIEPSETLIKLFKKYNMTAVKTK